ncbi:MAG: SgcJ/EcaC family oxidoreductase [Streptosporangiaceae bacterium]
MASVPDPADLPRLFVVAWNRRDAAAIADLFAADADFVNVVGLWWRRREEIRRAHDYGLRTFFRHSRMSLGRIEVRRLGEAAAVVHFRWRVEGQYLPDGRAGDPRRGVMVVVAERRGGEDWIAVAAQNTDVVSAAESLANADGTLSPVDYR